jgi:hypothetical protein
MIRGEPWGQVDGLYYIELHRRLVVPSELVTVETVSGLLEAEILRGLLEAAGVMVELSHEAALSAYSLGVGRMARVDVMVRAEQEALAREVIQEYRSGNLETPGAGE